MCPCKYFPDPAQSTEVISTGALSTMSIPSCILIPESAETGYYPGDATYRPFLKQVLEEIFNPNRPECPDIEHTSGGLTDLLKTGFSMFMKVNRPHPSDHPLLFLVLVGGVTPSELRLIREVVSSHKAGTQVLVVSTRLLRPTDVPHLLFTTNRLSPDIGHSSSLTPDPIVLLHLLSLD
ncbi:hypothetical protein NFI96_000440 [Prochilodus magdalenae]|nr:hypothetical protein NFI96_000440 [Prochilodus magdalenae]